MTGHIKMAKSANICVTIIKVQKKVIKNIGKNNLIVYIIDLGLKQSLRGVI